MMTWSVERLENNLTSANVRGETKSMLPKVAKPVKDNILDAIVLCLTLREAPFRLILWLKPVFVLG